MKVAYEFPNKSDTFTYTLKIYFPDGKIKKIATVINGKFSGRVLTYSETGKIYEIDSVMEPCDIDPGRCDARASLELFQLYSNPEALQRTVFYQGEKIVPNPFQ